MLPSTQVPESTVAELTRRFEQIRRRTESIVAHLEVEDLVVQSMPDVSPAKWHLGHTTWFFDEFILAPFAPDYRSFLPNSSRVFNSYYESAGERIARPSRGNLSRPTVGEILAYRKNVTESISALLHGVEHQKDARLILERLEIGMNHEQQHQELLYTDLKFNLYQNVTRPAYARGSNQASRSSPLAWQGVSGGLVEIGAAGGFAYDNEMPRHKVYVEDFEVSDRLITNAEYLEFMQDGGYSDFRHWLSDGWDLVRAGLWKSPLYWERPEGQWQEYTLRGMQCLDLHSPVTHISFHEAQAFAAWSGHRLLTEFEWEHAALLSNPDGNFLESDLLHPCGNSGSGLRQMLGDVWEWTSSAYLPYPRFEPLSGALGEYNGKFMNDQRVLRGGSCVTPRSHIRLSYRNFFQGDKRWQFSGIRLAR